MKRAVVVIASVALFSLAGVTQARVTHGWLGWNHAKNAIDRGADQWLPGSNSAAHGCHRLTHRTITCTVTETGYAPFTGADDNPAWSGWFADIRATRIGHHRVRVWSPFWGQLRIVRG